MIYAILSTTLNSVTKLNCTSCFRSLLEQPNTVLICSSDMNANENMHGDTSHPYSTTRNESILTVHYIRTRVLKFSPECRVHQNLI